MPISLIVNGTPYNYPVPGENPEWGGDATAWAKAITDAISTLLGPGDILTSTFSIDNNTMSETNINGLLFDPGTVRAANIEYAVYRISTSNPTGNTESGKIQIVYDDNATLTNKWQLTQSATGNCGVSFTIDDSGQLKYKSTDIGTLGYSGSIRFSAKALTKI